MRFIAKRRLLVVVAVMTLAGCAAMGTDWKTERAGSNFVPGTEMILEAMTRLTRQDVLANRNVAAGAMEKFVAIGHEESELKDGAAGVLFSYCYAFNSSVHPCSHNGLYLAWVPEGLRDSITYANDPGEHNRGDLLIVALKTTNEGYLVGEVLDVFRRFDNWDDCEGMLLQHGSGADAAYMLSPYGPPRAAWLECASAAEAGFEHRRVAEAPDGADGMTVMQLVREPR